MTPVNMIPIESAGAKGEGVREQCLLPDSREPAADQITQPESESRQSWASLLQALGFPAKQPEMSPVIRGGVIPTEGAEVEQGCPRTAAWIEGVPTEQGAAKAVRKAASSSHLSRARAGPASGNRAHGHNAGSAAAQKPAFGEPTSEARVIDLRPANQQPSEALVSAPAAPGSASGHSHELQAVEPQKDTEKADWAEQGNREAPHAREQTIPVVAVEENSTAIIPPSAIAEAAGAPGARMESSEPGPSELMQKQSSDATPEPRAEHALQSVDPGEDGARWQLSQLPADLPKQLSMEELPARGGSAFKLRSPAARAATDPTSRQRSGEVTQPLTSEPLLTDFQSMRDPRAAHGIDERSVSTAEQTMVPMRQAFHAMDAAASKSTTWIHAGAHHAEAGFLDPALGWVSVRADAVNNGVHATLVPPSSEAAQVLATHLAGLNAHLSEHHQEPATVTLSTAESFRPGDGMGGGTSADGGDSARGQRGHSGQMFESQPTPAMTQSGHRMPPTLTRAAGTASFVAGGTHISVMA